MKYELPSTELIAIEENNYLKFGEYLNDMQCDDTTNKLCLDDLEYVKKLQEENKQLQEELECTIGIVEHNKIVSKKLKKNQKYASKCEDKVITIENQQKQFIKYLEDKIKKIENNHEHLVVDMFGSYDLNELDLNILKEILQKYKSIIGEANDKK